LSVDGLVSAQPLLELQHLGRLRIQDCQLGSVDVQHALQQLSNLSTLTDLQISMRAGDLDEGAADVLLSLSFLRGLRVWYNGYGDDCHSHHDGHDVDIPVMRKLLKLSSLQTFNKDHLMLPNSSEYRLADAVCGMRGLQSLRLYGCMIGPDDSSADCQKVVRALSALPALRNLRLGCLWFWDQAALADFAAAAQLTGLMLVSYFEHCELVSFVGQVHKLSGLRSLWMDTPGMDLFDVDAAAASLTGLTELCLKHCNRRLVGNKFPGAILDTSGPTQVVRA
jgi:hypothetical protein